MSRREPSTNRVKTVQRSNDFTPHKGREVATGFSQAAQNEEDLYRGYLKQSSHEPQFTSHTLVSSYEAATRK